MSLFKPGSLTTGVALGVGFFFLAPLATKMLSGAGKPLLKETFKGGFFIYNKGRAMLAEARETLEDLTAEARSELSQAKKLPSGTKK